MADTDLSGLTLKELKALKKSIDEAMSGYERHNRAQALAAAERAAQEFGFTLAELTGGTRKRSGAGVAKYVHPENTAKTWTGFGRKPGWIADALAQGRKLEDFILSKVGVPTGKR